MKYITYNSDGKITVYAETTQSILPENALELVSGYERNELYKYYVSEGEIKLRPTQPTVLNKNTLVANGIDIVTITGAPLGIFHAENLSTVNTLTSAGYSVTGEIDITDTFSTTVPGTYRISIEAFPYIDFEATIEAT